MKSKVCSRWPVLTGLMFMGSGVAGAATDVELNRKEIQDLRAQIEILAHQLDEQSGPAQKRLHLGGYGEVHYNNLNGKGSASDKKELDVHRFVLFVGYDYSDTISFVSEFEIEHGLAGEGKNGEVEIEQAYIDFSDDNGGWRTGIFLIPVGFLNTTHEPPTFGGVERNNVEKNIIPTTWWEGGISRYGHLSDTVSYDVSLHSGLLLTSGKSYQIRSGRQKASEATASDLATTAAFRWQPINGLDLGFAVQYQSDAGQGLDPLLEEAMLLSTHLDWQSGPMRMKALYAHWDIEGNGPEAIGADEQSGWYLEPSYQINDKWLAFARFSSWDNTAGSGSTTDTEIDQTDIGVNFYPHEKVVLKVDYQMQDQPSGELDGFNLGVGYQF